MAIATEDIIIKGVPSVMVDRVKTKVYEMVEAHLKAAILQPTSTKITEYNNTVDTYKSDNGIVD